MRGVRVLLVALILVTVSSCSGDGARVVANSTVTTSAPAKKPTGVTLLAAVSAATSAAHTFRFETTTGATHAVGVGDVAARYVSLRSTTGMRLNIAMLQRGPSTFVRGPTGAWCWTTALVQSKQAGASIAAASPFAVLDSLRQTHARVERLGQEKVRGVEADHYRVVAKPTFDIWVDDQDRLLRETVSLPFRGLHISSTTDLFDFGTAVDVSTPPPNTPRCERG